MDWFSITLISCGTLIVFFLNIAHYKLSKLTKIILFAIASSCIFTLAIYEQKLLRLEWENDEFSGQITKIEITEEHALKEYTILNGNGEYIVRLDKYYKLYEFEIGDLIEKKSGNTQVEKIGEGRAKGVGPEGQKGTVREL